MQTIEQMAADAAYAQRFSDHVSQSSQKVLEVLLKEIHGSPLEFHRNAVLHSLVSALLMLPFQRIFLKDEKKLVLAGYAATHSIEQYLIRYRREALKKYPDAASVMDSMISSKEYNMKNGTVEQINDLMKGEQQ